MNAKSRITGRELRKSLNLVILGIALGNVFFTIVNGAPFTGFINRLGASDLVYSVTMAMPVVGGVMQVFASYFIENTGKRKSVFLIAGFIHRLLWIPIALIPLIVPSAHPAVRIWTLIVLITVSSCANSVVNVSFTSWMGSLVPSEIKGRFFSRRMTIYTASGALAGIAAGKFLDLFPGFPGFTALFIVVALFGAADILCFFWVKEPPMHPSEKSVSLLKLFLEPFKNANYVKFIVFVAFWNFGVNISAPFFNRYMLDYLHMSYFAISVFAQIVGNFATVFFVRYWGRYLDAYGNKPVMAVCCSTLVSLPALWCLATPSNYFAILLVNFCAGVFWPGYELAALNLSIWLAPEKNRSIYLANYTLINSTVGVALAYVAGGVFMEYSRPLWESLRIPLPGGNYFTNFHALFFLSVLFRLLSLLLFFPRFSEANSRSPRHMLGDFSSGLKLLLSKNKNSSSQ